MKLLWQNTSLYLCLMIFLYMYMNTTLHQNLDTRRAGTERKLENAVIELDKLQADNKKLLSIAKQLQKKLSREKHSKVKSATKSYKHQAAPAIDADFALDEALSGIVAPSVSHEVLRRDVIFGVNEHWLYISSQMQKIKQAINSSGSSAHRVAGVVEEVLRVSEDYRRALLKDLNNLTSLTEDWRKRESEELTRIVQKRIRKTQNPVNCSTARKLVCSVKDCGFGCQLHHFIYCFLIAHGTGRTLVIDSSEWRYSGGGWEKYFLPLSETCTDPSGESISVWGTNVENIQVVTLPIIDCLKPRPPYMPQAIPKDLAHRLTRLHGHPFVWFVGQFVEYMIRPQPSLAADILQVSASFNFLHPIVGVHVRRTDKLLLEASYRCLAEYMTRVDEYYDQLDAQLMMAADTRENQSTYKPVQRRIYLASDDPSGISEAKQNYPHYDIISDVSFAESAGLSSRYTDKSLRAVILDIHFLSRSDYLVCTFSSQVCRVAYGLMQTLHADASSYFKSLDDIYYYGGQNTHQQVAIADHEARPDSGEIYLMTGDIIDMGKNQWDGFSKGMNRRTGRVGLYPSYKVRENIDIANYPTFNVTVPNSSEFESR